MKTKLLLLGLTFFGIFALSACTPKEEEPTNVEYETLVGEFQSLGSISVNKKITHLFEDEDGEIYYAYSDRYDLDDEDYFGVRLEAYGSLMTYKSMDKTVFKVQRLSMVSEETPTDEEVTEIEYKDTDLGFSIKYPDNWSLEALRDSVQLTAPAPSKKIEASEDSQEEIMAPAAFPQAPASPDYIIIARTDAVLGQPSDAEQELRVQEVENYVHVYYPQLSQLTGTVLFLGPDSLFALRYKTENGDVNTFIPRGTELFELSFYHPEDTETDLLKHSNVYMSLSNSFRFLPYGESSEETESQEPSGNEEPATADQVSFDKYAGFESGTFEFKMSYPARWYYQGNSNGFDFGPDSFDTEDAVETVLRLTFNARSSEGLIRDNGEVQMTKQVGNRFYTLSGPAEYEDVIKSMIDSIMVFKASEKG